MPKETSWPPTTAVRKEDWRSI